MKTVKLFILTLFLISCAVFSGCELLLDSDHTCVFTEWEETEEATCLSPGREERFCIYCYETDFRVIPKEDHSPVDYEGRAATCTEAGKTAGSYCQVCKGILSGIQDIEALGHTVVIDPATEPTDDKPGRTEGKHCATCGEVLIKQTTIFSGDFSNPQKYHGDYAFTSLKELDNGEEMCEFYLEIDALASDFHSSLNDAKIKENDGNANYYMAEVHYSDNGITTEQALSAWNAYIKDHPLYYRMSSHTTYTDDYITLIVDDEYVDGEVREEINVSLYKTVEKYILSLEGEGSYYGITLGLHDVIIENASYAYENDGVTPSLKNSAHNILGVLLEGEGVCESYAKAFQLILNYYSIDNVFVTGYAGEAHAWNLVELDDGRWYWYDLTWDDQPEWMLGVKHNYFCVSSADYVDWRDGGSSGENKFLQDHTPAEPGGTGIYFSYELPEVSDTPYVYDGLMLRDDIIVKDGLSYVLIAFNKLALIDISKEGNVAIPETVDYKGTTLEISCIGSYDSETGLMGSGSVIEYNRITKEHIDVTSISIPSTVEFIWDFAFDYCYSIQSYNVSSDNPVYSSVNGVLFTKSTYTLIKYPLAKTGISYTVPESTVEIAFGAFGDGGNVFCPKHLLWLTIPESTEVIGAYNGGKGFRDKIPTDPSDILIADGYMERLEAMLGNGLIIK
ncbi:MAG: hypothetical protein IJX58_00425 [Clostridia bacterium]|nr:hypothetical protein [Clostridia bacterium]